MMLNLYKTLVRAVPGILELIMITRLKAAGAISQSSSNDERFQLGGKTGEAMLCAYNMEV